MTKLRVLLAALVLGQVVWSDSTQAATGIAPDQAPATTIYNSTATTSVTLSFPSGVAAGDICIGEFSPEASTYTVKTAPSGWTFIRSDSSGAAGAAAFFYWYKSRGGGNDPSSFTWALNQKNLSYAGWINCYSGVNQSTPIDPNNPSGVGVTSTSATSLTVPAFSSQLAAPGEELLLQCDARHGSNIKWTNVKSYQEIIGSVNGLSSAGVNVTSYNASQSSTSAPGPQTCKQSGIDAAMVGEQIALQPAPAQTPPPSLGCGPEPNGATWTSTAAGSSTGACPAGYNGTQVCPTTVTTTNTCNNGSIVVDSTSTAVTGTCTGCTQAAASCGAEPNGATWTSTTTSPSTSACPTGYVGTETCSVTVSNTYTCNNGSTVLDSTSVPIVGACTGCAPPATTSNYVSIIAPSNGATVSGTVPITVTGTSGVTWINVSVDGTYLGSTPFNQNMTQAALAACPQATATTTCWPAPTANESHTLSATAYASNGTALGTASITVIVQNAAVAAGELRPANQIPNNTIPSMSAITAFQNAIQNGTQGELMCGGLDTCSYMNQVNGEFTGTTTAILEYEADKWCPNCTILNPLDGQTYSFRDLVKANAVAETNWAQWETASLASPDPITGSLTLTPSHGDTEYVTPADPDGGSWGMFQIAQGVGQGWTASFPLSATSTAFNIDFKLAFQMGVEQGHLSYLKDPTRAQIAIANGYPPYADYVDANGVDHPPSTDPNVLRWGAVGQWYSGGWYDGPSPADAGALQYISKVQQILHNQPWNQPGF